MKGPNGGEGKPLRALVVEDSEQDAELLLQQLRRGGFAVSALRVDNAEAMRTALDTQTWDVIISDYSLPSFDAPAALAVMQSKGLDLPFIIVSGIVREEVAAQAMRSGAHDYFMKGKLGPRLIAAIEREVQEAAVRTENLKMQEQLVISDCLASIGVLAAGVAHEINNPLTSVMANIGLATTALVQIGQQNGLGAELDEITEEVRDAGEAAERIRNIVRDIKIFSRPLSDKTEPVSVEKVMESTLRMAWNEIRYRARVFKNYEAAPAVEASESRLGQVFLNLVVNAAQAMSEGRGADNKLSLSIGTDEFGYAVVEIKDTGPGISSDALGRVFQPGSFGRKDGPHSGIGLTICHRIVTDLGGSIDVASEIGKGTAFQVRLPPAVAPSTLRTPVAPDPGSLRRRGRILVIDNQLIGRKVARAVANDHEVIVAIDPEEALARIRGGEQFDVILCALVMSDISGMDVYTEVLKVAKRQAERIIFLTQGDLSPKARAFLAKVSNQRIQAPFDAIGMRSLINDRIR